MEGKTVLIIDDDSLIRKLIVNSLRSEPYRVVEAGTAQEVTALSREEKPDIILTDITLPDMDGWSAAQIIKYSPGLRSDPILAVTGLSDEDFIDRIKESGMDGFIPKPFSTRELPEILKKHLR
ncbi:MAG TPA: response regulator [Desulfobacteraceae bacterium]|nr:response regulator [Desulfobacteraceae bacterium]